MEQVQNHYHGSVTIQGANFQSHFVPAEKPYAVYAYVWEAPSLAIAQLVGTVLVGKQNKDGEVSFDGKPVYRMLSRSMLDFDHCFIPEDMGDLICDAIHLGFVGDTIGKDRLVDTIWMELRHSDTDAVKRVVDEMRLAGLKVELGEEGRMQDVCAGIDYKYQDRNKKRDYYIAAEKDIALMVEIWDSTGRSEEPRKVLSTLWNQILEWESVGVTFERIRMKNADYQDQADELLALARLYGKYDNTAAGSALYYLLACRQHIGTGRCLYGDYVMGMKKAWFDGYDNYDEDLEWAVSVGLIQRDGNIIQFSPDFERMASWKWTWKHGEDER